MKCRFWHRFATVDLAGRVPRPVVGAEWTGATIDDPRVARQFGQWVDAHTAIAYGFDERLCSPITAIEFCEVILSPYAIAIGGVLVVLIAAATAYAVTSTRGVMRRGRAYDTLKLPSELPIILGEFQESIERLQDEVRKAAKVDEAMVSALGPIELALQDFKKRINGLEKRTDEHEKQLTELKSMLVERQIFTEGNTRAIERSNTRLEELDRQSIAAADQLSSLKQMTESAIAQHERSGEELRAINSGLVALRAQLIGLVRRVHSGETGQKQLSELAQTMAKSVAALEAGFQETAQRIAGIEPRILWRIEHLETLSQSAPAPVDQSPADAVDDGRTAGTKASNED